MPDPKELKVGGKVKFFSLPEEWQEDGFYVHEESVDFMKAMIRRKGPSRICQVDQYGYPWIEARIRENGKLVCHSWAIMEHSGWRRVKMRMRHGG